MEPNQQREKRTLSDDTYRCLQLVAQYADIITQLNILYVLDQCNCPPLPITFHYDPWDLQHITPETLEQVVCLVGCVDIPPSHLASLNDVAPDIRDNYKDLFINMAKSRNVVAAAYALEHCERLYNTRILNSVMCRIGSTAVATGDVDLFDTIFKPPSIYLNKILTYRTGRYDDFCAHVWKWLEQAAFRGYPAMFRIVNGLQLDTHGFKFSTAAFSPTHVCAINVLTQSLLNLRLPVDTSK